MKNTIIALLIFFLTIQICYAQDLPTSHIVMPAFFGDNMVLQRDKPIKFWGTASPNAGFSIEFAGKIEQITADESGNWEVGFPAEKADKILEMKVLSDSAFSFKNIIMGDVWLCSGQSNMEFTFGKTDSIAYDLIEEPNIRSITTPYNLSNYPQTTFRKTPWQLCNKQTVLGFSAVAYFFAKKIYRETGVPIGIIHSSWGGTSIKAWMSEDGIAQLPEYQKLLAPFLANRYTKNAMDSIADRNYKIIYSNNEAVAKNDKGYIEKYQNGKKGTAVWKTVTLPGQLHEDTVNKRDKGIIWLRKEVDLPPSVTQQPHTIRFGRIVGFEEDMWINGLKVGNNSWWKSDNFFYISTNVLKAGKNTIAVRITDKEGSSFFNSMQGEMAIKSVSDKDAAYPIEGSWEITQTLTMEQVDKLVKATETVPPNTTVTSIYNAKIAPFTKLPITGFLWYQGENDAPVAAFYKRLFPIMINDWRQHFNQGNLPFLFVQLPDYNNPINWVEMREAQASALQLPKTAMAITLDVGNPTDIHPHNKKPVGERLANAALDMVYHKKGYPLCPLYHSFTKKEDGIHLFFSQTGGGLQARTGNVLKGFTIAGDDEKFVPAEATIITKNEVLVTSPTIKNPVAVRYAWTANPDANLVNQAGLPAAQCRTDNWKLMTEGKVDDKN